MTLKIFGVAGFCIMYLLSLLKIRKLKHDKSKLEVQRDSEKQKRFVLEKEKQNLVDANHKATLAHKRYKDRVEAYIKAQGDALRDHGINLVLEEDTPWGK